jgi:hypothetical protein
MLSLGSRLRLRETSTTSGSCAAQRTAPGVPGVAVLAPLPRMLFWLRSVAEQALVVNVWGFGLMVISGCDHPSIERMLSVTEKVLDLSIRAVVDGLHLERAGRTGCPFQA